MQSDCNKKGVRHTTVQHAMELNKLMALALGWTEIVTIGGSYLGKPPKGEPECRGQAKVPDWCGDWREAGPLIPQYAITIPPVTKGNYPMFSEEELNTLTRMRVVRNAIVYHKNRTNIQLTQPEEVILFGAL